eukprot:COSAG02_NODE_4271_length_5563_cov_3.829063_4_plen_82_part_00
MTTVPGQIGCSAVPTRADLPAGTYQQSVRAMHSARALSSTNGDVGIRNMDTESCLFRLSRPLLRSSSARNNSMAFSTWWIA